MTIIPEYHDTPVEIICQSSTTTPLDIELVDQDMLPASEPPSTQAVGTSFGVSPSDPFPFTFNNKAGPDEIQATADTAAKREGE